MSRPAAGGPEDLSGRIQVSCILGEAGLGGGEWYEV